MCFCGQKVTQANSSLDCLDDRVDRPVLATPGGELGQGAW